jgi:hypothetical protein
MRLALVMAVVLGAVTMDVAVGQPAPSASRSVAKQASGVTVSPLPVPPIPEGSTGIAARYPGDEGIEVRRHERLRPALLALGGEGPEERARVGVLDDPARARRRIP